VVELCKSLPPAGLPQGLLVLAHLAATQAEFSVLPDRAFKHLAKLPGLAAALGEISRRSPRAAPLVALLAAATAAHVPNHQNYEKLADGIIVAAPLGAAAQPFAAALLSLAVEHGAAAPTGEAVARLLRALDLRYPEDMERALSAAMDARGKDGGDGDARGRLFEALEAAFAGSSRSPLPEAGTTVALAVDAASAGVRRLALEKLDALAARGGTDSDAAAFLRAALLRRLADDSPSVVLTALGLPSLLTIPPAALLEALAPCLAGALGRACSSSAKKIDRNEARGVARKAVKLLTGQFAERYPAEAPRAAELVLGATLAGPFTRKLAATAIKRAPALNHPLLKALEGVEVDAEGATPAAVVATAPPAEGKKPPSKATAAARAARDKAAAEAAAAAAEEAKAAADAKQNRAVVAALAQASAADAGARAALEQLLVSPEPRARAVAMAVAAASLRLEGGAALAPALLQQLLARPPGAGHSPFAAEEGCAAAAAATFDETTGLPDEATLQALAAGELRSEAMQPAVALAALAALRREDVQEMGVQVRLSAWEHIGPSPALLVAAPRLHVGVFGRNLARQGPSGANPCAQLRL
jgi:hypothetical protein